MICIVEFVDITDNSELNMLFGSLTPIKTLHYMNTEKNGDYAHWLNEQESTGVIGSDGLLVLSE